MFVKRLHPNVFDVFLGNGFNNWTRVKRNHWGVSVIAGNRVPRNILNQIADAVK